MKSSGAAWVDELELRNVSFIVTRPSWILRSLTHTMYPRTFAHGSGSQGAVEGPALGVVSKGTFSDTNAATAIPSTTAAPAPIAAYCRMRFLVTAT